MNERAQQNVTAHFHGDVYAPHSVIGIANGKSVG
jgi:hypothetical protein